MKELVCLKNSRGENGNSFLHILIIVMLPQCKSVFTAEGTRCGYPVQFRMK